MKKKEKEFFDKLNKLCKDYEVSNFGESCANGKAIISFKRAGKHYYYFMFTDNWGPKTHSGSQIIEYRITEFLK